MQITYFNESNYGTLCGWWDKHQHNIIPYSSLPIGVVVSKENKDLAMAFLYTMDGVDVAQIAWTTTNPENSPRESYNAVDLAIEALLVVAKKKQKRAVIALSSSKGLSKILTKKNITQGVPHAYHRGVL